TSAQTVSCFAGSFAPGPILTGYQFGVHIDPNAAGTYTITSSFTSDTTTDPNPANNTSTIEIQTPPPPPPPSADLVDTLTGPAGVQAPGSDITVSLDITNAGPDTSANDTFTLTLSDGLSFTGSPPPCGATSAQTVSCFAGSFAPGPILTGYQFGVHIDPNAAGTYTITSSFTSDTTTDPNPANNTSTIEIQTPPPPPPPSADLVDTLTGPAGVQAPGSDITVSLDITNAGPDTSANDTFTLTLSDGLSFTGSPPPCGAT